MPQRYLRKRSRVLLKDRVEPGLGARHAAHRAGWDIGLRGERWGSDAANLIALHIRHEHAVERPVGGKPQLRTFSTTPSWRQNSMVRTLTSGIFGGCSLFSRLSTSKVSTPRRPKSAASASPIGPPPTISTGISDDCLVMYVKTRRAKLS